MTLPSFGSYTLTISTALYTVWLLPQILYNFRHHNITETSFLMHAFIMMGCAFDLNYGLGAHLPIQYLWVSCLNLTLLIIQHYQWFSHSKTTTLTIYWLLLSFLVISLITYSALSHHYNSTTPKNVILAFGWLANGSFLLYPVPQIIKQYHNHSATGISVTFIFLSLILNLLDLFSAYALAWPKPSYIGPFILINCQLILLYQHYFYHPRRNNAHEKTSTDYC